MTCIKTGCHVFIEPYGEYAYGDAYEVAAVRYFRLVQRSRKPLAPTLHFTIHSFHDWFDKDCAEHISTLITTQSRNHGYHGILIGTPQ